MSNEETRYEIRVILDNGYTTTQLASALNISEESITRILNREWESFGDGELDDIRTNVRTFVDQTGGYISGIHVPTLAGSEGTETL